MNLMMMNNQMTNNSLNQAMMINQMNNQMAMNQMNNAMMMNNMMNPMNNMMNPMNNMMNPMNNMVNPMMNVMPNNMMMNNMMPMMNNNMANQMQNQNTNSMIWNLFFQRKINNNNQTINVAIDPDKLFIEAINLFKIKANIDENQNIQLKFIFNGKDVIKTIKISQTGLQNNSTITVISLSDVQGA